MPMQEKSLNIQHPIDINDHPEDIATEVLAQNLLVCQCRYVESKQVCTKGEVMEQYVRVLHFLVPHVSEGVPVTGPLMYV